MSDEQEQAPQPEQAERQTRIREAVRDFFQHGLKEMRAKRARAPKGSGARPPQLFED
jgi:hypothetical protein